MGHWGVASVSKVACLGAAALCLMVGVAGATQAPGSDSSPSADLDRVHRLLERGHVDAARRLVEQALHDHPDSASAHYMDARLLASQGLFGPARDELSAASRIAPGLPFAHAATATVLRTQVEGPGASLGTSNRLAGGPGWLPFWVLLSIAAGGLVAWLLARTGRPPARPAPRPGVSTPVSRESSGAAARNGAAAAGEASRR